MSLLLIKASKLRVFDGFNRADNALTLGNADTGQAWQTPAGTWGVSGGKAYSVSAAASDIAYIVTGVSNCVVSADVKSAAIDIRAAVLLRYKDIDNYIITFVDSSNNLQLYKRVSGIWTQVANAASGITYTNEHSIRGILNDSSVEIFINGASKINATIEDLKNEKNHGLDNSNAGAGRTWDNFRVVSL